MLQTCLQCKALVHESRAVCCQSIDAGCALQAVTMDYSTIAMSLCFLNPGLFTVLQRAQLAASCTQLSHQIAGQQLVRCSASTGA